MAVNPWKTWRLLPCTMRTGKCKVITQKMHMTANVHRIISVMSGIYVTHNMASGYLQAQHNIRFLRTLPLLILNEWLAKAHEATVI